MLVIADFTTLRNDRRRSWTIIRDATRTLFALEARSRKPDEKLKSSVFFLLAPGFWLPCAYVSCTPRSCSLAVAAPFPVIQLAETAF
jgi:hypothetical protein